MRTTLLLIIFSILCITTACGQNNTNSNIELHSILPIYLSETSGLVKIQNTYWTHNDGQDGPRLYQIEPETGKIIKKIKLTGAKNIDWEDITADDEYIYIADTGNNNNRRRKLNIYKIKIASLISGNGNITPDQTIEFIYGKKKTFNCEALVAFKDRLLLFTKNGKGKTKVYSLNKNEPSQDASNLGELYTFGSITGGLYNPVNDQLVLIGYKKHTENVYKAFCWSFNDISSAAEPEDWRGQLHEFDLNAQIEGIAFYSASKYLVSAERTKYSPPRIFVLSF